MFCVILFPTAISDSGEHCHDKICVGIIEGGPFAVVDTEDPTPRRLGEQRDQGKGPVQWFGS
jgi:hypothetical protein